MNVSHGRSVVGGGADAICTTPCLRWTRTEGWATSAEPVAAEVPLAIEIVYERGASQIVNVLAVTMRTPGHDEELAVGFLRAEGVITARADIKTIASATSNARGEIIATQRVHLARAPREDVSRVSRGLLTSSACGLCGRTSLEGLPLSSMRGTLPDVAFSAELMAQLPDRLREHQVIFSSTGGSHGAALCDQNGTVLLVREDVGRHNAVDKLCGAAWLHNLAETPAILVLSGRASFELVQKAAAAEIPLIAAVGAPSSLAVDLAHAAGITLVGFTRPGRFNVYTHAARLDTHATPIAAASPRNPQAAMIP